ncbi:MAG: STAS domain-containing protein [Planctomycetota bacterium]|nr:STAS domain-containing protein [Planctomycetota bacterium]MDI6788703.1 STAS domain-containing protein [Planctomycetota bacterium]
MHSNRNHPKIKHLPPSKTFSPRSPASLPTGAGGSGGAGRNANNHAGTNLPDRQTEDKPVPTCSEPFVPQDKLRESIASAHPVSAGGGGGRGEFIPPQRRDTQTTLLTFERQNIPLITKSSPDGSKYCTLLRVHGSIDISTHQLFENVLSELLEQNSTRLIINLAGLKYISSSGMGLLIKYYKKYLESDGNIKLSTIPPHIEKALDLIGMNNVLEILKSDKEALSSFRDNESYRETAIVEYPAKITCPSCSAPLEITKPAKYRCQFCNTYFDANNKGKIKSFPSPKTRIVEIKLSDSPDSSLWLVSLAKSQCQWLGFSTREAEEFGEAFREIWQLCTANKKHQWQPFRVTLLIDPAPIPHPSQKDECGIGAGLTVGITSFENLGVPKELLNSPAIRQKVTSIEILPLLPEGELIKITKTR